MILSTTNFDAEVAIISLILNNPEYIFSMQSVRPFMFSTASHQLIYNIFCDIVSQGGAPEYNLFLSIANDKNKLLEVGGQDYIDYLKSQKVSADNLHEYVRLLTSAYKTRALLQISGGISNQLNSGKEVSNLIADIKTQLDNLEETSLGEQVVDMSVATSDMWTSLMTRISNPGVRGVTTGLSSLDAVTGGFNPGDLIVIAGRPGSGKSAQMCNSALAVADYLYKKGSDKAVQIFSLEMNRNSLMDRFVSIYTGIPLADIRLGSLSQEQLDVISESLKYLRKLPIHIDTNFSADEVYYSAMVRKYQRTRNVCVTYFDYVQLASERQADQTAEIGRFTRAAKILANELSITNVIYSQLSRAVELREDKRPILSDLRQSGNIEEDADIVGFLYRDDYYNPNTVRKGELELILRKHRNGPTGTILFKFNQENLRIT